MMEKGISRKSLNKVTVTRGTRTRTQKAKVTHQSKWAVLEEQH